MSDGLKKAIKYVLGLAGAGAIVYIAFKERETVSKATKPKSVTSPQKPATKKPYGATKPTPPTEHKPTETHAGGTSKQVVSPKQRHVLPPPPKEIYAIVEKITIKPASSTKRLIFQPCNIEGIGTVKIGYNGIILKTIYFYTPYFLYVNGKYANVSQYFIHEGSGGTDRIGMGFLPKEPGTYTVVVKSCRKIPVSYKYPPPKMTPDECDEMVSSNEVVFHVIKPIIETDVTKTITPKNKTVEFTLEGGTYYLICESEGDTYPRIIKVTENYPPSDPRAKVLYKYVIAGRLMKKITIDSGIRKVYVYISCGVGAWKVRFIKYKNYP